MLADYVAAAYCVNADFTLVALLSARMAVKLIIIRIVGAFFRLFNRICKHERCAALCVDFLVVVRFDYLDVKAVAKHI